MKPLKLSLAPIALLLFASVAAPAQSSATAARNLQLTAWAGLSGTYTGLSGGKNLGFTAGADLGLLPLHGVRPTIEVRGTYPVDGGQIDSQKSVLVGGKFDFLLDHRLRPYADFLFGRGEMDYNSGGYLYAGSLYALTTTNVLSPGGGVDYDLNDHFLLKVDAQFQHWGEAPTPSGSVWAKSGTVALVYRFNFGPRTKRVR